MREFTIQTVWKTASQQCEIVFGPLLGYHVRLWVEGRLRVDEILSDAQSAVSRAWELQGEWPLPAK